MERSSKLHKLRRCPVLIQYQTQETVEFDDQDVTVMVSEYVEGDLLRTFLDHQPATRRSSRTWCAS